MRGKKKVSQRDYTTKEFTEEKIRIEFAKWKTTIEFVSRNKKEIVKLYEFPKSEHRISWRHNKKRGKTIVVHEEQENNGEKDESKKCEWTYWRKQKKITKRKKSWKRAYRRAEKQPTWIYCDENIGIIDKREA